MIDWKLQISRPGVVDAPRCLPHFDPARWLMVESRRDVYRIIYPAEESPTLTIGSLTYSVIDCSERGARYSTLLRVVPDIGEAVQGSLTFRSGTTLEVAGKVIRVVDCTAVMVFDRPGIPYSVIYGEQRWLRSKGYVLQR